MTRLTLVAAMATDRLIGRGGDLPWRLSSDLKRFKRLTLGKPLVMGRKTYDSIGRPLPGRRCIVLSRSLKAAPDGTELFGDLDSAMAALAETDEVIIGGGAAVYAEALPRADRLCLSVVHGPHGTGAADEVYFPAFDTRGWTVVERLDVGVSRRDQWPHTYFDLRRGAAGETTPTPFPAAVAPAPPADA